MPNKIDTVVVATTNINFKMLDSIYKKGILVIKLENNTTHKAFKYTFLT